MPRVVDYAFRITRVELADEPGILGWDIYGMGKVPFKFGETVRVRGVPADSRSCTRS